MKFVTVSADALFDILSSLTGPPHLIMELQITRGLLGSKNPIDVLIEEYNTAARAYNEAPAKCNEVNEGGNGVAGGH